MGKLKEKLKSILDKFKDMLKKSFAWMSDNKELTVLLVPVAASFVGGTIKIARDLSRKHDIYKQKMLKQHYVYDPSNGDYIRLKRAMKNRDAVELDQLRKQGMTVTEALYKMNMLHLYQGGKR